VDTFGEVGTVSSMAEERKQRRTRRSFSDEFKASAAQRVLEGGKTIPQVARDLDLTESALRAWVEQTRTDAGKGKPGALTSSEREELTRLRKEVRELRMDREILKKAAAFFAKEKP
jgi:transposase